MAEQTLLENYGVKPEDVSSTVSGLEASQANIAQILDQQQKQFADLENVLNQQAADSSAAISQFEKEVLDRLSNPEEITVERQTIDIEGIVAPMREALNSQITTMRDAYTANVAVQAKQMDALMGSGAFGGNAYRAQQAYRTAMSGLMSQSLGQIASTVLNAESSIMQTAASLTGAQAQINAQAGMAEAELRANRDVQLLGLLGNVAQMTVEAGSTLTNSWLNLQVARSNTVTNLIELMTSVDFKIADVRFQQARDVFAGEMQLLSNQNNLRIAMVNADAARFAAVQQRLAAKSQAQAASYAAQVGAAADVEIAQISAMTQLQMNRDQLMAGLELLG